MAVLLYMCLCAYYTVFRLKFFSFYHLDPHGQTDANSLTFAAMLLCRFLLLLRLLLILLSSSQLDAGSRRRCRSTSSA